MAGRSDPHPDAMIRLTELRLRDWWRVFGRELRSGISLGAWLGFIGFLRIWIWQHLGLAAGKEMRTIPEVAVILLVIRWKTASAAITMHRGSLQRRSS